MARTKSDPQVRAYLKAHPGIGEEFARRMRELEDMGVEELLMEVELRGVALDRVKTALVNAIVAKEHYVKSS